MSSLTIRRLTPDDADASFILARLDDPSLTAEDWRAVIEGAPEAGGVLGAVRDGRVRGILRYSLVATPTGGRLFDIEALTAFDLFDPAVITRALVQAALTSARQDHGCARIGLSTGFDAAGKETVLRCIIDAATLHRVF